MKLKIIIILQIISFNIFAQIYKDSSFTTEQRVHDLLSRMTNEEKFMQLFMVPGNLSSDNELLKNGIFGLQVGRNDYNNNAAIQMINYNSTNSAKESAAQINEIQKFFIENTRLGIPIIPFDEALHGLIRPGATCFPQSIALAATWDTELAKQVFHSIALECKSRGIRQILSPVLNLATDVRWGRVEETYGEDPYLVSEMGKVFVSQFEKSGIITTPKHFVANVGEGGRDSYPIELEETYLRETHLIPFESCFKNAGARSVMTAYNSLNGSPCTANDMILNEILKKEWNFQGFVISDAGATGGANVLHFTAKNYADATAKSINSGLDVIFQTSIKHKSLFTPPFFDGRIDQKRIDDAVSRVLRAKFELGLFDDPYIDPEIASKTNGNEEHIKLSQKAAIESIVLLKNENQVLPIDQNKIKSIALIGPDADTMRLGGYSRPENKSVTILQGLRNKYDDQIKIKYLQGCERTELNFKPISSEFLFSKVDGDIQNGLEGKYYNNISFSGEPALVRIDKNIDFQWTLFSPDPDKLNYDFYSVLWQGIIKAPLTGKIKIGIDGNDGYRLYINNKLIIDNWIKKTRQTILKEFNFVKNQVYDIRIEYYEPTGNSFFRLVWDYGIRKDYQSEINKAVKIAKNCDIIIFAGGIEEGEFRDRAYLNLLGHQEELIKKLAETGKPIIVILTGGSAITMNNWINDADAILDIWYPGQEGGNAVATILSGGKNPGGKLPVTFPVYEGQLPLVYNHKPTGRGDDYLNLTGQPLFPFGFGMSYTSFEYSDLKFEKKIIGRNDSVVISFILKNTGKYKGDEIVQLYIRDELSSVSRPLIELKGFRRISLYPDESQIVQFTIKPEMLEFYDINKIRTVEPGDFRIMIGSSSRDIRLRDILKVY
jgi:beta-glucosidase